MTTATQCRLRVAIASGTIIIDLGGKEHGEKAQSAFAHRAFHLADTWPRAQHGELGRDFGRLGDRISKRIVVFCTPTSIAGAVQQNPWMSVLEERSWKKKRRIGLGCAALKSYFRHLEVF